MFANYMFQIKSQLLEMLNFVHKNKFQNVYPNISISYQIYHTVSVTSTTLERKFNKLKFIQIYQRYITEQARLNYLSIITVEKIIFKFRNTIFLKN
jgi:hypothetical protein